MKIRGLVWCAVGVGRIALMCCLYRSMKACGSAGPFLRRKIRLEFLAAAQKAFQQGTPSGRPCGPSVAQAEQLLEALAMMRSTPKSRQRTMKSPDSNCSFCSLAVALPFGCARPWMTSKALRLRLSGMYGLTSLDDEVPTLQNVMEEFDYSEDDQKLSVVRAVSCLCWDNPLSEVRDGLDAISWRMVAVFVDSVAQVNDLGLAKLTFGRIDGELVVNETTDEIQAAQQIVHVPLASLRSITQTRWHAQELEEPKWSGDGSLWNVFHSHWYLVVCPYQVNGGEDRRSVQALEDVIAVKVLFGNLELVANESAWSLKDWWTRCFNVVKHWVVHAGRLGGIWPCDVDVLSQQINENLVSFGFFS
ncbi:hypothetical protein PV325_007260 [Microctonus aethiopoides]|nr:hypothetical protein PV325_007260 [Microctonus aethiopoides]